MRPTNFENMIADQQFKITPSDDSIMDFIIDCGSFFNSKESEILPYGNDKRLDSQIN